MNANRPVLSILTPPSPAAAPAPQPANTGGDDAKTPDFAQSLAIAGKAPERKSAAKNPADPATAGTSLPPHGNPAPPTAAPPAAAPPASAAVAVSAAALPAPAPWPTNPTGVAAPSAGAAPPAPAVPPAAAASLPDLAAAGGTDAPGSAPPRTPSAGGASRAADGTAPAHFDQTVANALRAADASTAGFAGGGSGSAATPANATTPDGAAPGAAGASAAALALQSATSGATAAAATSAASAMQNTALRGKTEAQNAQQGPPDNAAVGDGAAAAPSEVTVVAVAVSAAAARQEGGLADKPAHDGEKPASPAAPTIGVADAAAGAAALHGLAAAATAGDAAQTALPRVTAPIDSPQFTQQVAERVSYLLDHNLNGATLQVSPPQLGPIELRVAVDGGHAQVWFSAHSAATCEALRSSATDLRDMLATQGFGQVSVDVSQRSFQERGAHPQNFSWASAPQPAAAVAAADAPGSWTRRATPGRLDAYA